MSTAAGSRAQLLEQLRGCIGEVIVYEGEHLQLHDLVVAEGMLVFKRCDATERLQTDLHGEARRRVPPLRELPAFQDQTNAASQAARALLDQGDSACL